MKASHIHFMLGIGLLVLISHVASAQWVQTNQSTGGRTNAIAGSGTTVFAGTLHGAIFRSTDGGTNWTAVNTGLTNADVQSLLVDGSNVLAGTLTGLVLSTDNGTIWTPVDSGLTNTNILSFAVSGSTIFAGTGGAGVFQSTYNGASWSAVDSGLAKSWVYSFAVSGGNIFAGTFFGGVYLSTNNGTSWGAVNAGLADSEVYSLALSGTDLFAGTWGGGVFLSNNAGGSWTAVDSGLGTLGSGTAKIYVRALAVNGSTIFAGTDSGGVFMTTNSGTSWSAFNTGLTSTNIWSLAVVGNNIFAGVNAGGVWRRPLSEMGVTVLAPEQGGLHAAGIIIRSWGSADGVAVEFFLPHQGQAGVEIYNLSGHRVASLINRSLESGHCSFLWDTRGLAAGCYTARIRAGTRTCAMSIPVSP